MTETKIATRYFSDKDRMNIVTEIQTHGAVHKLSEIEVDLQDQAVRAALADAGWTPPEGFDCSRLATSDLLRALFERGWTGAEVAKEPAAMRAKVRFKVDEIRVEVDCPLSTEPGMVFSESRAQAARWAMERVIDAMRKKEAEDATELPSTNRP